MKVKNRAFLEGAQCVTDLFESKEVGEMESVCSGTSDLTESSAYEETRGPRAGVELSLEQADLILQRHLGIRATGIAYVKRGYNNRTYIVTAQETTYVIRVCGKFWTRTKTENEVAAIVFLTKKCPTLPLPTILGYCTDRDASGVGVEYMLMKTLQGKPLDDFWFEEMDFEIRKKILAEIGGFLAKFKSLTFATIGSFRFTEGIGNSLGIGIDPKELRLEDILVGPDLESKAGPFQSYLSYLKATFEAEVENLKKCPFMLEGDLLLPRIQQFIDRVLNPQSTPLSPELLRPDFVMTHGDFEPRNILVDEEDFSVTGLLDWEFSGSFPVDNDWLASFAAFGCDTSESAIFDEPPFISIDHPDPKSIAPVREEFLKILEKNKIANPQNIPFHQVRSQLYYFHCNICPWFLREHIDPIPEDWYKEREHARRRVDCVLKNYNL